MLPIRPLLAADPSLPEEVRDAVADSPEEAARALHDLGVGCDDAMQLAGLDDDCCE